MQHHGVDMLEECSALLSALKEEVMPTFGPAGVFQLIVTTGQELTLTKSSAEILEARRGALKHPILKFVIAEVLKFHRRNGDGCATFLILLEGAFANLKEHVCRRKLGRKVLAGRIKAMMNEWTLHRFTKMLSDSSLNAPRSALEETDWETLHALALSSMSCELGLKEAQELASLLIDWIRHSITELCYEDLSSTVCQIDEQFDALFIPTVQHERSHVVEPGKFIISKSSLSTVHGKGSEAAVVDVRFIVLRVDFSYQSLPGAKVAVNSAASLVAVHDHGISLIKRFVRLLASCRINLVLSIHELPHPFLSCFKKYGIFAVQCLPGSQAHDLVHKTGVVPIDVLPSTRGELLPFSRQADSVKEMKVGAQSLVVVAGLNKAAGNRWIPQVIAAEMSMVTVRQFKRSLRCALKLLKQAVLLRPYLPLLTTFGGSTLESKMGKILDMEASEARERGDIQREAIYLALASTYAQYAYSLLSPRNKTSKVSLRAIAHASRGARAVQGLEFFAGTFCKNLPPGWRFVEKTQTIESLALKMDIFHSVLALLAHLLPIDGILVNVQAR